MRNNVAEKEPKSFETLAEALDAAEALKAEGNAQYKRGVMLAKHTAGKNSLAEACKKYAHALSTLHDWRDAAVGGKKEEDSNSKRLTELLIAIYLNLGLCSLALNSFDTAINCCDEAIKLSPDCAKAYFRRGKAKRGAGALEDAERDFIVAARLKPSSKEVRSAIRGVRSDIEKCKQAKELRKATELGRERQRENRNAKDRDAQSDNGVGKRMRDMRVFAENIDRKHGLASCLEHGGRTERIVWGQSLAEVHVFWPIPGDLVACKFDCCFRRDRMTITCGEGKMFADEKLKRFARPAECTWQLEDNRTLHVTLFKEPPTNDAGSNAWWPSPFVSVEEVAVPFEATPPRTPPIDGAMEDFLMTEQRRAEATRTMNKEQARIKESQLRAMEDPNKRGVLEMMKEKFPGIPVEFR